MPSAKEVKNINTNGYNINEVSLDDIDRLMKEYNYTPGIYLECKSQRKTVESMLNKYKGTEEGTILLEKEIQKLKSNIQYSEIIISAHNNENNILKNTIKLMEEEIDNVKRKFIKSENQRKDLKEQWEIKSKEYNDLKSTYKKLT